MRKSRGDIIKKNKLDILESALNQQGKMLRRLDPEKDLIIS